MSTPAVSYTLRADQCPAIQVGSATLSLDTAPTPYTAKPMPTGVAYDMATRWNSNAVMLDLIGRYGSGGVGIAAGLDLEVISGLNVRVTAGKYLTDGYRTLDSELTTALIDNLFNYLWISNAYQFSVTTSASLDTPGAVPSGSPQLWVYLGEMQAVAGTVVTYDRSGVPFISGQGLYRKTGDVGPPTDAPPAGSRFINCSLDGLWEWDGDSYHRASPDLRVTYPAGTGFYLGAGEQRIVFGDLDLSAVEAIVLGDLVMLGEAA